MLEACDDILLSILREANEGEHYSWRTRRLQLVCRHFRVAMARLVRISMCWATDAMLASLPNLTCLDLSPAWHSPMQDAGPRWRSIPGPMKCLIGDATLRSLTSLRALNLSTDRGYDHQPNISDEGVRALTGLTMLVLRHNQHITDTMLPLPLLTSLALTGSCITEAGLHCQKSLTALRLGAGPITSLAPLVNLTSLSLLGVTSMGDEALSCLTNLTSLRLAGGRGITGKVFRVLPLHTLVLEHGGPCERHALAHLTRLQVLRIHDHWALNDESLATLTSLTELCVSQAPRIRGETLHRLPCLTVLDMRYSAIETVRLRDLSTLSHLFLTEEQRAELGECLPRVELHK